MKTHSNNFKNKIKDLGRQLKGTISYGNITLENQIYKITPHYEADILKSVMKQLDLELSVDIPLNTVINCQIGILVGNDYEMLDYGNYVVYSSEKQEDTGTYKIICYDKILYSMKPYESLNVTYPIKIKDYLTAIANKIGLTVATTTFYNQNKEIQNELYLDTDSNDLGYTFRDVLDEIAQATGSIICLNESDEIILKYPTQTNDTIDESYLKDVNVNFGEMYGAINTIVLSRSAESDNVYYPEILPENPVEIKIVDNQIMNWDDRSDYLQGIYNALNGLYYYINDFNSTGILYYDVGDLYNIQVGENTYQCLMLNDEVNVTTGIEEIIYTEKPKESETDYSKADKTDRKINQTKLIVNKQAQQIQGIISQIGDRSQKTTTITADIDGLNSRVEDIEDLTNEVNGTKTVTLENCIQGSLLELHIYGNNTVFDYLYPADDLYPANDLYPYGDSRIVVTDENNNSVTYELGITEVLRQNGNVRDEYILENSHAQIIRRISTNGGILANETIEDLGDFHIDLEEGTNTITIKNYTAPLKCKYAIKSDFTEVFATKVEMSSSITQTAEEINLEVSKKVGNDEVISKINQSAEAVGINANKIDLSANDVLNLLAGNTINLSGKNIKISSNNFNVDETGNMTCTNANINGSITSNNANITGGNINMVGSGTTPTITIQNYSGDELVMYSDNFYMTYEYFGETISQFLQKGGYYVENESTGQSTTVWYDGIVTPTVTQTSKQEEKKNFEKYINALDVIKNIDIYKYNFKNEENGTKKHIGFVIGKDYKYSEEVTSKNNDGVDIYSFVSLCCQAIKEQQEEIEKLRKEINK